MWCVCSGLMGKIMSGSSSEKLPSGCKAPDAYQLEIADQDAASQSVGTGT